jgi:WD repeat-containing protein 35
MRKKLGDWFKVLQLLKTGPNAKKINDYDPELIESDMLSTPAGTGTDIQLEEAYNEIGEYYVERQRWETAVKFYIMGRNLEKQAECYYILEDYDSLCKILDQLQDNNEILPVIFNFFFKILDYKTRTNLRCKILVFYIYVYICLFRKAL